MSLKSIFHWFVGGCGLCLPVLVAIGLLVPGCAGKRSEMLSSLMNSEAPTASLEDQTAPTESAGETLAEEDLIAETDTVDHDARLSAYTAEEIIEGPPKLRDRIRALLGRRGDVYRAEDPFIDQSEPEGTPPEKSTPKQAIAEVEEQKVEELLASFQTASAESKDSTRQNPAESAEAHPWWESAAPSTDTKAKKHASIPATATASFSEDFDSRLDRLRAELEGTAERQPATEIMLEEAPLVEHGGNVDASFSADDIVITSKKAPAPNLMSEPIDSALKGANEHTPSAPAAAKARIKAMLADAHRDVENWNLRRAYRTALDAQELAIVERVEFDATEESPRDLIAFLESELRSDMVIAGSSKKANPVHNRPSSAPQGRRAEKSAAATFGFAELDRLANPWTAKASPEMPNLSMDASIDDVEPFTSAGSGVSLLPPDDDFPSDAASDAWESLPTSADEKDIQLATHNFSGFSFDRDRQVRDEMSHLSQQDSEALRKSVIQQRSRVFDSPAPPVPSLSSQASLRSTEVSGEPIRVAEGPRFTLNQSQNNASTASSDKTTPASTQGGSLLGQFWGSQSIWLIGGLLLLIVALRVMPWPKADSASE